MALRWDWEFSWLDVEKTLRLRRDWEFDERIFERKFSFTQCSLWSTQVKEHPRAIQIYHPSTRGFAAGKKGRWGRTAIKSCTFFVEYFSFPPDTSWRSGHGAHLLTSGRQRPPTHRGRGISDVKGSVCFLLRFALPPLSPPLPLEWKFQNKKLQVGVVANVVQYGKLCSEQLLIAGSWILMMPSVDVSNACASVTHFCQHLR